MYLQSDHNELAVTSSPGSLGFGTEAVLLALWRGKFIGGFEQIEGPLLAIYSQVWPRKPAPDNGHKPFGHHGLTVGRRS